MLYLTNQYFPFADSSNASNFKVRVDQMIRVSHCPEDTPNDQEKWDSPINVPGILSSPTFQIQTPNHV